MEQANRNHESWMAMQGGHDARGAELLAAGLDPNVPDSHGHTPLCWAAGKGLTAIVDLLLTYGAEVAAADQWGWTALHMVAHRADDVAFAQRLLAHGANVHATDTAGRTAVDGVPERGHSPSLEWDDRNLVLHTPLVVR